MIDFTEINAESAKLLNNFNAKDSLSKNVDEFFNDEVSKERRAMLDFFRSFDELKSTFNIEAPLFNEKAGFTSEYKDIMTGRK
jgi:NAD kinase